MLNTAWTPYSQHKKVKIENEQFSLQYHTVCHKVFLSVSFSPACSIFAVWCLKKLLHEWFLDVKSDGCKALRFIFCKYYLIISENRMPEWHILAAHIPVWKCSFDFCPFCLFLGMCNFWSCSRAQKGATKLFWIFSIFRKICFIPKFPSFFLMGGKEVSVDKMKLLI